MYRTSHAPVPRVTVLSNINFVVTTVFLISCCWGKRVFVCDSESMAFRVLFLLCELYVYLAIIERPTRWKGLGLQDIVAQT